MILVVADDLTGAAELAAAAADRGLRAWVHTVMEACGDADVLALDLQTRSLVEEEACRRVASLAEQARRWRPEWIYLKTDSALRGHIAAELETLAAGLSRRRVLFVPANPSRKRCIIRGEYLIDGVPLDRTRFARDPEHPRRSARVLDCLGMPSSLVRHSIGCGAPSPDNGLVVPDAASVADLDLRAGETDEGTLPAGALEFFCALLGRQGARGVRSAVPVSRGKCGRLLICGSLAAWEQGRAARASGCGMSVVLPFLEEDWQARARETLHRAGGVLLAIGPARLPRGSDGADTLARAAHQLIGEHPEAELLIEGGATAGALFRRIGWRRFEALGSLGGTARLRVSGGPDTVWIKPGSYPWPERIWEYG